MSHTTETTNDSEFMTREEKEVLLALLKHPDIKKMAEQIRKSEDKN